MTSDWVMAGAGYAGLAATNRLAENRPSESVIVLEADTIGEGHPEGIQDLQ